MHESKLNFLLFSFQLLYKRYADLPHWGCVKIKKIFARFPSAFLYASNYWLGGWKRRDIVSFFPLSYYFPNCETAFLPTKFYIVRYRKQSRIFFPFTLSHNSAADFPANREFFFKNDDFLFFSISFSKWRVGTKKEGKIASMTPSLIPTLNFTKVLLLPPPLL